MVGRRGLGPWRTAQRSVAATVGKMSRAGGRDGRTRQERPTGPIQLLVGLAERAQYAAMAQDRAVRERLMELLAALEADSGVVEVQVVQPG